MANVLAVKSGNWSDNDVWEHQDFGPGVSPSVSDDVMANGYIVTIDQDVTVSSVRTDTTGGATASGAFTLADGYTLTADVVAGGSACVSVTSGDATIVGDLTGGSSASAYAFFVSSTGTQTVTGTLTGGSNNSAAAVGLHSTGTVNVNGDVTGGSGPAAYGVYVRAAGTMSITGDVTGGSNSTAAGVYVALAGGTVNITGDATGATAPALWVNHASATIALSGTAIGGAEPGAYWQAGTLSVRAIQYGANGESPTSGKIKIANHAANFASFFNTDGARRVLSYNYPAESVVYTGTAYGLSDEFTGAYDPNFPAEADVEYGVSFGPSDVYTGTFIGSSVAAGSTITIVRGDTMSQAVTGLGTLTGYTNLWFTVKAGKGVADSDSLIQIDKDNGLLYVNGSAAETAANGSITVDDASAGDITIALDEVESAKLSSFTAAYYDVQMQTASGITTLTSGSVTITQDVTRATS